MTGSHNWQDDKNDCRTAFPPDESRRVNREHPMRMLAVACYRVSQELGCMLYGVLQVI